MSDINEAPEWAKNYFAYCRDLLWLNQWDVGITQVDKPNESEETDGCNTLHQRYLQASIQIRRGLTEERGRNVILHETLHITFSRVRQTVDRIAMLLPEELQAHAQQLYDDAEEETIEHLTRALLNQIQPKKSEPPQ